MTIGLYSSQVVYVLGEIKQREFSLWSLISYFGIICIIFSIWIVSRQPLRTQSHHMGSNKNKVYVYFLASTTKACGVVCWNKEPAKAHRKINFRICLLKSLQKTWFFRTAQKRDKEWIDFLDCLQYDMQNVILYVGLLQKPTILFSWEKVHSYILSGFWCGSDMPVLSFLTITRNYILEFYLDNM